MTHDAKNIALELMAGEIIELRGIIKAETRHKDALGLEIERLRNELADVRDTVATYREENTRLIAEKQLRAGG